MRPRLIPPNARIPMLASASLPLAGAITNGQRPLLETAIDLYDQLGDVRHAATVFPGTTLDKAGAIESYRIFFAGISRHDGRDP